MIANDEAGRVIVVMGVSGSGKSTVGEALAATEGWDFQEGDAMHPASNIAKMHAGHALDDEDRRPWLARVAAWIGDELRHGRQGVVTCSALKRDYRDRLRRVGDGVRFVYLQVPAQELRQRLGRRQHFMPAILLDSQLHALEEPQNEPDTLIVTSTHSVSRTVEDVRHWLEQPLQGADPLAT